MPPVTQKPTGVPGLTGILKFAIGMAVATFIENDYGTQTAKALVYNAWWFEAIMAFFIVNFFGSQLVLNLFKYYLMSLC